MHHQIDSLAYTNKLRSLPPEHKLGFGCTLFILGYLSPAYLQLIIALWLLIWVVVYAQIPWQVYGKMLAIPLSFWFTSTPALIFGVAMGSTIDSLNSDLVWGAELGQIWLYLSYQGLEKAKIALLRTICLTSCMYFILLTVPLSEIIRVLRQCGCPSLLTELLVLMYRFIFVLTETASELLTAQTSRLGYSNWQTAMKSLSLVIGQLLQRSLDNYRQLSLGLASRGYTGELQVQHSHRHRANKRYTLEAIAGISLLLILIIK